MDEKSLALDRLLKAAHDDPRRERILNRIAARRHVAQPPLTTGRLAFAAAAAALVVLAVALGSRWLGSEPRQPTGEPAPLYVSDGGALARLEAPDASTRALREVLSDGSRIELAPGTLLNTVKNDGRAAELLLERGQATFDIVPGKRRWTIDAGLGSIEVIGTRFTVERTEHEVIVAVERGTVRLRSARLAGGERLLHRGERIAVAEPSEEPARAATQPPEADEEPSVTAPAREAAPASAARWAELARRGQFDEAYGRLGTRGLVEQTERARSLDELMLLADVARLSGHPREAVAPLEQAIASFGSQRRAAVAAFTLGRLQADVLANPASAVEAFERCLALGPPAALHGDALARLAEARDRAGDHEGARAAAREYLQRYPEGQHARFLDTLLGR